jgi:hypothetical protein
MAGAIGRDRDRTGREVRVRNAYRVNPVRRQACPLVASG